MNRTKIEWVKNPDGTQGYTWNPITGCLNHVNGLCNGGGFPCYAYKLAHGRLKSAYCRNPYTAVLDRQSETNEECDRKRLDPFYPRFWEERVDDLDGMPLKPCGIFVCDMGELFGDSVPREWQDRIFTVIRGSPGDRFYLLTKQPQNLIKFSPFPKNCWVGVTATNAYAWQMAPEYLSHIEASVRFVSLEPMLEQLSPYVISRDHRHWLDWLIIGACTGSASDIGKVQRRYPNLEHKPIGNKWTAQPPIEWVKEIVEAADKAGIKVFLKDNLDPLLNPNEHRWAFAPNLDGGYSIRQELPE
jgi:protein gp37